MLAPLPTGHLTKPLLPNELAERLPTSPLLPLHLALRLVLLWLRLLLAQVLERARKGVLLRLTRLPPLVRWVET